MRILRLIRNKLKSRCGETLTETLASLLIIVPAMVMLAGAIVTAARINFEARKSEASNMPAFTYSNTGTGTILKDSGAVDFTETSITWGHDDNSIYYYFR